METTLIGTLRKIQLDWEMNLESLAVVCHTSPVVLEKYLKLSNAEIQNLPSVPPELANAVALMSVYQKVTALLPDPVKQNEWLITPNAILENQKPIEVMAMSANHVGWVSYTLESSMAQTSLT
jgi:hypothetical protein